MNTGTTIHLFATKTEVNKFIRTSLEGRADAVQINGGTNHHKYHSYTFANKRNFVPTEFTAGALGSYRCDASGATF